MTECDRGIRYSCSAVVIGSALDPAADRISHSRELLSGLGFDSNLSDGACDASPSLFTRTQAAAQAVEGAREVVFCHPDTPSSGLCAQRSTPSSGSVESDAPADAVTGTGGSGPTVPHAFEARRHLPPCNVEFLFCFDLGGAGHECQHFSDCTV